MRANFCERCGDEVPYKIKWNLKLKTGNGKAWNHFTLCTDCRGFIFHEGDKMRQGVDKLKLKTP